MKILVFEQDNCGWCTRLHPHIKKLAEDSNTALEFVDIQGDWDKYQQYQIRTTPTVIIFDEDIAIRKFSIQTKGIPELISGVKDFINQ